MKDVMERHEGESEIDYDKRMTNVFMSLIAGGGSKDEQTNESDAND